MYLGGLAQGMALVTFPALSGVLTNPTLYGLSTSQYGTLFVPLVVLAILGAALGPGIARRSGLKWVFVAGLGLNLVAMAVLILSQGVLGQRDIAYETLLLATAALGAGFGTTLMALNAYVAALFPTQTDVALPALHAFLGTGTTLAPLLAAIVMRASWWILPAGVGAALLGLAVASLWQPLRTAAAGASAGRAAIPRKTAGRLGIYAGTVLLYGICETLFGNWAPLYLHDDAQISAYWADIALAAFWAMVTAGRIATAATSLWIGARRIYLALPFLILIAFLGIPRLSGVAPNVMAFGFAGIACSAFLPLSISFAEEEFSQGAATVSGSLVAAYMVGYGIGAFGVGPVQDIGHLALSTVYTGASVLAAGTAVLAFVLARPRSARARG
jgi:predicted MFS family arabinose efflux permease